MKIFRRDPAHPIRKRLWQGGMALFVIVFTLNAMDAFERVTSKSHTLCVGADFLPVYAAGILVREGRGAELYIKDTIAQIEWQIIKDEDLGFLANYGAFMNPPFFAAMYVPFTYLSYRSALMVWVWLNIGFTLGAIVLLCRMLPNASSSVRRTGHFSDKFPGPQTQLVTDVTRPAGNWKQWILVPVLLLTPLPLHEATMYQQNTFLSLFVLCVIITLWRRTERISRLRLSAEFCAGIATGFLFYKPQLALAVAGILALTRGWRTVGGMTIMGIFWLVLSVAAMPGSIVSFLDNLGPVTRSLQEDMPYHWHQQMTPGCFFRFLFQGFDLGPAHLLPKTLGWITTGLFACGLGWAAIKHRRNDPGSLDRLIAATLVTMPLLMPYYMDYDLMLLAVAATLFAADWIRAPQAKTRLDYALLWTWIAFFLELYINPGLARYTKINFGVLLLATLSVMTLARCIRRPVAIAEANDYDAPTYAEAA